MNEVLLRCQLLVLVLPFVISTAPPAQLWRNPPFINVLPRTEVKYLDPEGKNISMDEEIDGEVTLALLNYAGDFVPQILKYPQNISLGAELREGEVKDGNKWYLFIKNRQDYESEHAKVIDLSFNFLDWPSDIRTITLHIENIDDNPPVITGDTCQVSELRVGPTNCVFKVTDDDGSLSLNDMIISIVSRKEREDEVFEVNDLIRTEFFIEVTLGTKVELSYEEASLFIFSLKAVDPEKNEGRFTVVVQVKKGYPDETTTVGTSSTDTPMETDPTTEQTSVVTDLTETSTVSTMNPSTTSLAVDTDPTDTTTESTTMDGTISTDAPTEETTTPTTESTTMDVTFPTDAITDETATEPTTTTDTTIYVPMEPTTESTTTDAPTDETTTPTTESTSSYDDTTTPIEETVPTDAITDETGTEPTSTVDTDTTDAPIDGTTDSTTDSTTTDDTVPTNAPADEMMDAEPIFSEDTFPTDAITDETVTEPNTTVDIDPTETPIDVTTDSTIESTTTDDTVPTNALSDETTKPNTELTSTYADTTIPTTTSNSDSINSTSTTTNFPFPTDSDSSSHGWTEPTEPMCHEDSPILTKASDICITSTSKSSPITEPPGSDHLPPHDNNESSFPPFSTSVN